MQYLRRPQMVLLDLDGTLVDTAPDLAWAMDRTLQQLGLPPCGEGPVRSWMGSGIEHLIDRALTAQAGEAVPPRRSRQAMKLFLEIYQENLCLRSSFYPGVTEGLTYLQGQQIKLGCVTNKRSRFTCRLLHKMQIHDRFAIIVSGDTLRHKKPHPAPLLHATRSQGVSPSDALMIGDSEIDVQAARAATLQVLCVNYGYYQGRDIHDAGPDAVIDSLAQLPELFRSPLERL